LDQISKTVLGLMAIEVDEEVIQQLESAKVIMEKRKLKTISDLEDELKVLRYWKRKYEEDDLFKELKEEMDKEKNNENENKMQEELKALRKEVEIIKTYFND